MKILVDGVEYPSKKKALDFFMEGMMCCDGSERDRYIFAYQKIQEGCDSICTYSGYAIKR